MSSPAFEDGRYLYCAVVDRENSRFETSGIEDEQVSLISRDQVAVVVHPVQELYDSDDMTTVRRWLLDHQRVVDEAGDTFGTPLPFQFDTILQGDDATVRTWLDDQYDTLEDALLSLRGCWEYRIGLEWDASALRAEIEANDPSVDNLVTEVESASEGTAYLLEKQLERSISERVRQRRRDLAHELTTTVDPYVEEIKTVGGNDDRSVVEVSVLASSDQEGRLGQQLETFAERPLLDVTYTGPWPPYSFAPVIGGDDP